MSLIETHLGLCGNLFISEFTREILDRYLFEKKYNVSSFGNDFDKIPLWWKHIVNIIENESFLIKENKQKESDLNR